MISVLRSSRRAWQPTPVCLPGESPWTEVLGKLQTMGSQRVGHNWATKHSTAFIRYLYEPDPELNICAMQSLLWGFPGGSAVKNLPAKEGEVDSILGSGRSLGKEAPIFLPGKSHEQRSLVGYSPWVSQRVGHDWVTKQQQIFIISTIWMRILKNGEVNHFLWVAQRQVPEL